MKKVIKVIFGISFIFYLLALVMLLFVGVMFVGIRGHILDRLIVDRIYKEFFKFRSI